MRDLHHIHQLVSYWVPIIFSLQVDFCLLDVSIGNPYPTNYHLERWTTNSKNHGFTEVSFQRDAMINHFVLKRKHDTSLENINYILKKSYDIWITVYIYTCNIHPFQILFSGRIKQQKLLVVTKFNGELVGWTRRRHLQVGWFRGFPNPSTQLTRPKNPLLQWKRQDPQHSPMLKCVDFPWRPCKFSGVCLAPEIHLDLAT